MASVKPSERVAFVGKTGSGKSYAARLLTRGISRLVVIDPKGTLGGDSGWNLTDWNSSQERKLKKGEPCRIRVPAPLDNNYEPYFKACYDAQNVTVYIDEMYGVVERGKPGQYLTAMYTRGRELNIGVYAATQRPTWVPLFILSEADWLFVFRLQLDADRARLASIMGAEVAVRRLQGHQVFVYHQEWNAPVLYNRMKG